MTQIQVNPTSLQNLANANGVNAELAQAQHELEARIGVFGAIKRGFAFLGWVFTGFGLVSLFRRGKVRGVSEEIVVYTVHPSFYLWAIIALGFIASACVNHWPGSAVAWGWAYVLILMCTIVTLLFDVSTLKALLWGGIFCLVWIASKYLEDLKGMTILSGVGRYLTGLHPRLDSGTASVISWLLLVPWVGALFHAFSRGRKAFSPNSIEERFFGEGREITDRMGLKFRTRYRDWFETVFGLGACDLEAVDGNHHVVKRWENILFLSFIWRRLDSVLHQRAATVDNAPSDPVEVEEVHRR